MEIKRLIGKVEKTLGSVFLPWSADEETDYRSTQGISAFDEGRLDVQRRF